jgi:hypothetical protein
VSLSACLSRAAENASAIEARLAAVPAREEEHGPLTEDELAAADRVLDRAPRAREQRRPS